MKRCVAIVVPVIMLLLGASPAGVPAAEDAGISIVTTDELKSMMDRGEDLVLINALSPLEFTQTKIKDSINVPYGKLKSGEASLPEGKGKTLVFYCLGPK